MLKQVSAFVRHSSQGVEAVSTDTVRDLLEAERDQLVLLDTRSLAEYEVSHLEGAVHVDPDTVNMDEVVQSLDLADNKENKDLVCYCTVGYRSSKVAQKLNQYLAINSGQSLQGLLKTLGVFTSLE
ncbi:tRNA uridine(34) hydroxylase-like isoform X2 [Callorhinchus milii]|uniref:tRNA uridine(34) hydroxylase-like isoform X2 n=1 Tax=Callorhinchus milii TaxID=7868 RepID=UPI001C3F82A0|nr:tRNA uridine(34) hydroxylase-like isoform X2 [Callorhinchus milii]